jgi:hypothetical protein
MGTVNFQAQRKLFDRRCASAPAELLDVQDASLKRNVFEQKNFA